MTSRLKRRAILGLGVGTVAAAGAGFGMRNAFAEESGEEATVGANAAEACDIVSRTYQRESARAGGTWNAYISVANPDGTLNVAVDDKSDVVLEAWSVNKIPVAVAVLDKVDRGLIKLNDTVEVSEAIVIQDDDGIFHLDAAYPSQVTVGHALANLLTVSDNTSVRLCGLVAPALEINEILVEKGFPKTQVEPVANPNRFFLGQTTPKEMHDLINKLVAGELLSPESTTVLLNSLRAPVAFTDGIRRNMSSAERMRVATKAGWFDAGRHEAGIIWDASGRPSLTYGIFSDGAGTDPDNFGATHPALEARAKMGRAFMDSIAEIEGVRSLTSEIPEYNTSNGG